VRANRDIRQCNAHCREKGNIADGDRMKSHGAQVLPGNGGPGRSIQDRISGRCQRRRWWRRHDLRRVLLSIIDRPPD